MLLPKDIANFVSRSTAIELGQFLEFSTRSVGSPSDLEDLMLLSLTLKLNHGSRPQ